MARWNPGERVLLVYEAGLDFISAFFGCLYAGMPAVPVCPPRPSQSTAFLEAMVADCQAALGVTTRRLWSALQPRLVEGSLPAGLPWLATDDPSAGPGDAPRRLPAPALDAVPYLQYTSGQSGW